MTHSQHPAGVADSLYKKKPALFLTEQEDQGARRVGWFDWSVHGLLVLISYLTVLPSGVDVQETEEDCTTEATTPNSFEPYDQTQTIAAEPDQSAVEEVSPVEEAVGPAVGDGPQKEEEQEENEEKAAGTAVEVAPPNEGRDSEKGEEPASIRDSGSQSADELLADWREDLEAFKQMERDELWQAVAAAAGVSSASRLAVWWCRRVRTPRRATNLHTSPA